MKERMPMPDSKEMPELQVPNDTDISRDKGMPIDMVDMDVNTFLDEQERIDKDKNGGGEKGWLN